MVKYFCDCCGEEREQLLKFEYYCHIQLQNIAGYVTMIDGDSVPTSGRPVEKQVCQKCYNEIMETAYNKFKDIQENSMENGFTLNKDSE